MCHVSYKKNGVKYTVFRVAYTLAELALTAKLWSKISAGIFIHICRLVCRCTTENYFYFTAIVKLSSNYCSVKTSLF